MTNKQKTKMYQQIETHGENLNRIFNTGIDPIKLCKKLRSLEAKANKLATDYCNGENDINSDNWEDKTAPILNAVKKILFVNYLDLMKTDIVFFNGDARGYSLKISDKFIKGNNYTIYTDY